MKRVLVIGASGMVASRFVDLAKGKFDICGADEKTLDITDLEAVQKYFDENSFDVVVNFAAFTNVDGAEAQRGDESGLVYRLNVNGPKYLAGVCKAKDIFLVHISTDFVFPGTEECPGPYDEDASLPETSEGIGWYGWTKNRAESQISNLKSQIAVVRYGYPFRSARYEPKLDWARNLIKLYNEQKLYPLFNDQTQSVIFIDDLVEPLSKMINEELTGIFHIVSAGITIPYEIGRYLLEKYAGKPVEVEKGSMEEFLKAPGRTPRPRFGGLKTEKTQELLGMKFRSWREMVDDFVANL